MSRLVGSKGGLVKTAAAVAAAGVVIAGLVNGAAASAEPTVQNFLLAWGSGQYRAAAAMTTGSTAAVAGQLSDAYAELDATGLALGMGPVSQNGESARAGFSASVDLGSSGLVWHYQGHLTLRRAGSAWKVVWSPSVIAPGLGRGDRLAVVTTVPPRGMLLDSTGHPLERPSEIYLAGVRPVALTRPRRTAAALAAVTGLDADQIYGQIVAAPSRSFLDLVRFSPADYRRLRGRLGHVPGLDIRIVREDLLETVAPAVAGMVGTETAPILREGGEPYLPGTTVGESGLEAAYQRTLAGTPRTQVVVLNSADRQLAVLARWPGHPGASVQTTINSRVQLAANHTLAGTSASAAIVAVQPGTGRILAAAQRRGADLPVISGLNGRYPPGQAFTIVSTAALLATGFNPRSRIPCHQALLVGGQTFSNGTSGPRLGAAPTFTADFANACGTAFAGLSERLEARQLDSAAEGFGLGTTWRLPVPAFSGTTGQPGGLGQVASAAVGSGGVRVSPLGMALVAAAVDSGVWHPPALVIDGRDRRPATRQPFGPEIVSELRALMRATVAHGAGRAANVPGQPTFGQVGSVPYGKPGHHLSWFVGYRGGVAFAVIMMTGSAGQPAAALAGRFLRELSGKP